MKEVITTLCGTGSCYVGSHFFNIQEAGFSFNPNVITDVDNDVLFREGLSGGELLYTPRVVTIDGSASSRYVDDQRLTAVANTVHTQFEVNVERLEQNVGHTKSEFLCDIEKYNSVPGSIMKTHYSLNVHSWTDYLFPKLHPRSLSQITMKQNEIEGNQFQNYSQGLEEWRKGVFNDSVVDGLRFFAEECDCIQGFHLVADTENGFSGIASGLLSHFQDEYNKKEVVSILPIGSSNSQGQNHLSHLIRCFNIGFSSANFCDYSGITVPLTLETDIVSPTREKRSLTGIQYEDSMYHETAIFASAFDMFTLPYRLKQSNGVMSRFVASMAQYNRTFLQSFLALPITYDVSQSAEKVFATSGLSAFNHLSPTEAPASGKAISILASSRGLLPSRHGPSYISEHDWISVLSGSSYDPYFFQSYGCKEGFRLPPTFPDIWKEDIIKSDLAKNPYGPLKELKVAHLLLNSDIMSGYFNNLSIVVSKNLNKIEETLGGCEKDDLSSLVDKLSTISDSFSLSHQV